MILSQHINNRVTTRGASFVQQFLLHKGLKVFGEHGHEAATKEMDQLHRRNCFTPISVKDMTSTERRKAMGALMFLRDCLNVIFHPKLNLTFEALYLTFDTKVRLQCDPPNLGQNWTPS